MRFFITGTLQSKHGPRQILTGALFLLLLFVFSYAAKEFLRLGFTPESIAAELHRSMPFGERSMLSLWEELHIDLLVFSMLMLLLGSLVYHLPYAQKTKSILFGSMVGIVMLYPLAKILTYAYVPFAWLTLISGILLHSSLLFLILFLYKFLYSK